MQMEQTNLEIRVYIGGLYVVNLREIRWEIADWFELGRDGSSDVTLSTFIS
jgi:hypothetical protein